MDRRAAIRNILIASASTLFIPGCTETKSSSIIQNGQLLLDSDHSDYLSKISESFLPVQKASDKIGKPLDFILRMLNDCYSPEQKNQYASGFHQFKQFIKDQSLKIEGTNLEKALPIIEKDLENSKLSKDLTYFINTTKQLSIQHFTGSEYYMTEYLNYKLIPGTYKGCVEV